MLNEEEFDRICAIERVGFKTRRFRAVYRRDAGEGAAGCAQTACRGRRGCGPRRREHCGAERSRREADEVPVPSLLAVGCVHNHLIRAGVRTFADIVVGAATPCLRTTLRHWWATPRAASIRTTHMRASAIGGTRRSGRDSRAGHRQLQQGCDRRHRLHHVKMGISTVQSYHSAQIFEAVGFTPEFVNAYFAGTVSRVGRYGCRGR